MDKERIVYLDVIRVVACMMVILMHSPLPGNGAPAFVMTGISFVTAPCIGLFFMVSGSLLLPVRTTMKAFYKKRLLKVVIPTLVWTIVYLIISWGDGMLSSHQLLINAISIPFYPQRNGIMWFMYTLIGQYLLSPIISPWLNKATKKEVEFVLCLWFISLCLPLISRYIIVSDTGILYYFSGLRGIIY